MMRSTVPFRVIINDAINDAKKASLKASLVVTSSLVMSPRKMWWHHERCGDIFRDVPAVVVSVKPPDEVLSVTNCAMKHANVTLQQTVHDKWHAPEPGCGHQIPFTNKWNTILLSINAIVFTEWYEYLYVLVWYLLIPIQSIKKNNHTWMNSRDALLGL